MKAIPLAIEKLEIENNKYKKESILNGLFRGGVGFVIAPPESGKSYLTMSIAYELALAKEIIGISDLSSSKKTLLWPIEDGIQPVLSRLKSHDVHFDNETSKIIERNVSVYKSMDPLYQNEHHSIFLNNKNIDNIIAEAKSFDLVIIDTLRVAMGSADEVKDDFIIQSILEKIAKEADVAVLAIHHPTKAISRGLEVINSVAGSGLSRTLSSSKLHLYLEKKIDKKKETTNIRHIKANYLDNAQRWKTPKALFWTDSSMLISMNPNSLNINNIVDNQPKQKNEPLKKLKAIKDPVVFERDESKLSEESLKLAEIEDNADSENSMLSELTNALKK